MTSSTKTRVGTCIGCDVVTYGGKAGRIPTRCESCRKAAKRRYMAEAKGKPVETHLSTTCVDCGQPFALSRHATRRVRCDDCRESYGREQRNEYSRRNPPPMAEGRRRYYEAHVGEFKARKHDARVRDGATKQRYSRDDIFERDGWICYLCKLPVDKTLRFPHPGSASLDHVLTLSRGGDNAPRNVRLAHMSCNWYKGIGDANG